MKFRKINIFILPLTAITTVGTYQHVRRGVIKDGINQEKIRLNKCKTGCKLAGKKTPEEKRVCKALELEKEDCDNILIREPLKKTCQPKAPAGHCATGKDTDNHGDATFLGVVFSTLGCILTLLTSCNIVSYFDNYYERRNNSRIQAAARENAQEGPPNNPAPRNLRHRASPPGGNPQEPQE